MHPISSRADLEDSLKIRVLLVDDNEAFLHVATDFLQRQRELSVVGAVWGRGGPGPGARPGATSDSNWSGQVRPEDHLLPAGGAVRYGHYRSEPTERQRLPGGGAGCWGG